jgi:hypothetical protein
MTRLLRAGALLAALTAPLPALAQQNIVLFVADGLRAAAVSPERAKVLLPHFKEQKKPFMLLYWSSDPDGTQHSQRDSLGEFTPGNNGPTSLAAIKVADDDFAAIQATLKEANAAAMNLASVP